MRRIHTFVLAAAVLAAGCADLDVTNPNEPDRERVLSSPVDVQALISTAFQPYFDHVQQTNPGLPTSAMADNLTGGFYDFGVHDMTTLPREQYNPSPLNTRGFVGRAPWSRLYPVVSNVNDGLTAIEEGLVIEIDGVDQTPRARAFGKFMQGLVYGHLAMYFDQALIVTEETDLEQMDPTAFSPYLEVQQAALDMFEEAVQIAESNNFVIPASADWVNGTEMDTDKFIRVINSYRARLLAYTPRNWEDRAAVNWQQVLSYIDAGIQEDFGVQGLLGPWESNMRRLLSRVRARPSDHVRPHYMALGPADTSGAFQEWFNSPYEDRMPFQIVTPDRRIQGDEDPSTPGSKFGYDVNNIWPESRGTYRWSHYEYHGDGMDPSWHEGFQQTMTVTEMNLLKAEALIRLDRAAEAVPLINETRVANGELPPVTVDGPPADASCVPRQVDGDCGSLWDALIHERQLENMAVQGTIMWWDFRGLGRLQEGTPVHFPVSGIEMENLGLALYSFGGVGGDGAAPPAQYHRCPTNLPRCE